MLSRISDQHLGPLQRLKESMRGPKLLQMLLEKFIALAFSSIGKKTQKGLILIFLKLSIDD